jgi:uncharacterized membrane protein
MIVEFIGRLHPLLVHLPIGIFILAFVVNYFFKDKLESHYLVMQILIGIACVSGIFSALCGWLLLKTGGFAEADVNTHKWSGIVMVIFSICLLFAHKGHTNPAKSKLVFNILFILTMTTVFSSAFLGAQLTYGEGFLWGIVEEAKVSLSEEKTEMTSAKNQQGESDLLPEMKKADSLLIEQLVKKGFTIKPIYQGSGFLQVSAINKPTISDVEMQDISALAENIIWLDLRDTKISDKGLAVISGCKNIKKLDLHNTQITSASAGLLGKLISLEYLNITGTLLDDNGLQQLNGLMKLKHLYVWNTAITKEVAKLFESKHPGLIIQFEYPVLEIPVDSKPK